VTSGLHAERRDAGRPAVQFGGRGCGQRVRRGRVAVRPGRAAPVAAAPTAASADHSGRRRRRGRRVGSRGRRRYGEQTRWRRRGWRVQYGRRRRLRQRKRWRPSAAAADTGGRSHGGRGHGHVGQQAVEVLLLLLLLVVM